MSMSTNFDRRTLLQSAAVLLVDGLVARRSLIAEPARVDRKIVLVTCGGIRRQDTFSDEGIANIPHIANDLLPRAAFFPFLRNSGVTAHYNTVASLLTGQWQRLDDWGKTPPAAPTLFELARRQLHWPGAETWLVSSNKAMTNQIGASSVREFGPAYGANVVFPKQLLINAVVHAAAEGRAVHSTDRSSVAPELEAMLAADSYDGLGWSVGGQAGQIDPALFITIQSAIRELMRTSDPVTGDEFTYLVTLEIMRRFSPSLMVVMFSDMEVAHFGSYAMHLAGIRTVDRLVHQLWNGIQSMPAYRDKTTLFVLPEFGRDADGSSTNGFFNHRLDDEATRMSWMFAIGQSVRTPHPVERPFEQISLLPTLASILGLHSPTDVKAPPLEGLWL